MLSSVWAFKVKFGGGHVGGIDIDDNQWMHIEIAAQLEAVSVGTQLATLTERQNPGVYTPEVCLRSKRWPFAKD